MPHAAELLLADLDPATRRQIWKAALVHAAQTSGHVEQFAEVFFNRYACHP
jgi:hypothetical protein